MSDTPADLVIQISASVLAAPVGVNSVSHDTLITELRQRLQPGVEISLMFQRMMATTTVLWLSEVQADGSFRAGVRLVGVSGRPDHGNALSDASEPDSRRKSDSEHDTSELRVSL